MQYYFREATVVSKSSSEEIPQGNYPCYKPYAEFTVDTNKIQMKYKLKRTTSSTLFIAHIRLVLLLLKIMKDKELLTDRPKNKRKYKQTN
jgi:hypothetical protein